MTATILLYHGTTEARWNSTPIAGSRLYLVASAKDAENYACESGESDWDDEIHVVGEFEPKPIVLKIDMTDIKRLADAGAIEIEPDWGWVEQVMREQPGAIEPAWQDSLREVGSFCIPNFESTHKALLALVDHHEQSAEI